MSEILTASRVIGSDGNIRYDVRSEPTEYISGNKRRLNFMWDTGAFISVLSVANFVKNRDSEDYKRLERSIDEDTDFIDYNSVSGSGKGVLRKIRHLGINDLLVDSFYFLLVKDVKRVINGNDYYASVALLGADFIDFCRYEHGIESDIIVNSFDNSKYSEYHSSYKYRNKEMIYIDLFAIEAG